MTGRDTKYARGVSLGRVGNSSVQSAASIAVFEVVSKTAIIEVGKRNLDVVEAVPGVDDFVDD